MYVVTKITYTLISGTLTVCRPRYLTVTVSSFAELSYGIVDVDRDPSVTKSLRIPRIPCVGAVVDGRAVVFESSSLSVKSLREFTRKLFPPELLDSREVSV